jgi:hypothetical protein
MPATGQGRDIPLHADGRLDKAIEDGKAAGPVPGRGTGQCRGADSKN